ncbi:ABC transporter ATP-binding protein [Antrihabitans cavernicola]|uniref:ABC transporter ATP-binding protein n=2 Tax=Antrihabitans cavernicola TaxID=2495913 RepID=A0A5A7S7Z5_9NOCA|nr:ABC transporter ATP-binding protein [Spelaeibacter cavernicola]
MGIIAQRHRPRALVTATVSSMLVAFVAGGLMTAIGVGTCGMVGGIVGNVKRRRRGLPSVLTLSLLAGAAYGLFSVGMLLVFSATRDLFFDTVRDTAQGLANLASKQPSLVPMADAFTDATASILRFWYLWIGGTAAFGVVVGTVFAWFVLGAVLDRLSWLPGDDHLDSADDPRPVDPLPVRLDRVGYRYDSSRSNALTDIDFTVDVGEFVAIVGHNGSGKSTLARILAGRAPSYGTVIRPGAAGLGKFGGTAVVLQRPESQILGVLVADDVVWGLPADAHVDVDGLLAEVGLAGMGDRETASLSGGEQQRLAVAAALARRPKLLIADEATAMVDPAGRRELVALLAALPRTHEMAVVLITHHETEADAAQRVIHLAQGRVVGHLPAWHDSTRVVRGAQPVYTEPILRLAGVRHTYLAHTPWSTVALHGIDLTVNRGEGVLIVGGNGSGKSTLAWTMAGLIAPTAGTCELDGKPTTAQVGKVGLAFQHSRLQLQRRTVGAEVASWGGGIGSGQVARALDAVGLDRGLASSAIDELSGGQARRVVLAGLMASRPRLIVLDEPLAGLDPAGRRGIIDLLAGLRASGLTLIVISHDVDGMDAVCNRTVRLDAGRIAIDQPSPIGGVR